MRGLPEIDAFSFSAVVGSLSGAAQSVTCALPGVGTVDGTVDADSGFVTFRSATDDTCLIPKSDIVVDVRETASGGLAVSAGGSLASLFSLPCESCATPGNATTSTTRFLPQRWVIYIDTSASTADTFAVRTPLIAALLDRMPQADSSPSISTST